MVNRPLKSPEGTDGEKLGTQVQVWMFPGGKEGAWSVDLADGDRVGGSVKMCSDGALNGKREH